MSENWQKPSWVDLNTKSFGFDTCCFVICFITKSASLPTLPLKKYTYLFFCIVFHLPMLGSWSPGKNSNVNITSDGNLREGEEDERLIEAQKSVSSSLTAEPWKILCSCLLASCLQDLGGYCLWPASWSGHRQFDQRGSVLGKTGQNRAGSLEVDTSKRWVLKIYGPVGPCWPLQIHQLT